MIIRRATLSDFETLYQIGLQTPELRVSATEVFMDADEFRWCITNPDGVFLVAENDGAIAGFIYATANDAERPFVHKYACMVYLVVTPAYQKQGIARALSAECETRLRNMGITHVYTWANAEGNAGIIAHLKHNGFTQGHQYVWMDKALDN